ncbi:flagellar motor protein MotB [Lysobacteraceae bacterium NML07-0707]|nr:flagellar motor protein MotB [Xanthomonadaceae bacterium NML07-0707]
MKEKPSEWIAISDLMAGVMAVVMLLLVVSVWQKAFMEAKHAQEAMERADPRQAKARGLMEGLKESVGNSSKSNMVDVDVTERKITLREGVYALGSACVTSEARLQMQEIKSLLSSFLSEVDGSKVYVEGHTDNRPVARPVTDYVANCTVYDDNFTLSAARAREARKLLISGLDEEASRSVIVAGYGDSQPLSEFEPSDSRQRRVEVRIVLSGDNDEDAKSNSE